MNWLILHYKLPAQPSALRVYVWRKLKKLGAVFLNDSVWVLPDTSRAAEQMQWLSTEIQEMQGDVNLWRSNLIMGKPEESLVAEFTEQVDKEYNHILKKLERKNPDIAELSHRYRQISDRDYFHSVVGKQVKEKLLARRGAKG
jgi:ChrB-like protein